MKRSEMLAILDKEINKRCDYGTVFWSKDIEAILTAIEQAGMLPPENGKEASYIIDYRFKCLKWDEE